MADAEERARKREERRRQRKEKGEFKETEIEKNDQGNHLNGHPDISRETVEGLEQKSDAALPDVVKVPSGLNEDWERPITPEIDDEGFARGNRCGLKSYSSAIAAQGQKSQLQKRKEQYSNTALSGKRYGSDEDAEFEPEVQSPRNEVHPSRRPADDIEQGDDEWSHLSPQRTTEKPLGNGQAKNKSRKNVNNSEFYTNEELNEIDGGSESSSAGDRSRKVSDEWKSTSKSSKARGVNKPKSYLKKSDSWIRERPELPEEPTLKEPEWLDLVRKRRWRSTVKARFPQSERERIQFERRLDTSKKGLKFNPRGEPTGITGPDMDDELSIYLLQQRRRIQSDDVFESSLASSSRSAVSSERSFSESDYSEFSFDQDPRNRELAAEKGILNLSRPPIKGPKKEVHKNLAMERSRQSTMKWRFSIDPQEDPLWTQLPRPNDIQAINDMEGNLEAKFWSSKKKFQSGQFNPPPVPPKPRSRSSSSVSRSHSASEIDFDRRSSYASNLATEEMMPMASRSSVKDMKQKLASGEFLTSTPLPVKPVELEEGYMPRLRDVQQRLADEAESSGVKVPKPNYISSEELASMGDRKKSITEETFTEKTEVPKPVEKPRLTRRRSDAEFLDLLASRKEEVDASAVETAEEISSVASDISKAFGKDGDDEQRQQQQKEQQQREKERKEQERKKEREEKQKREEQQRQKEREEQRQKEREEKQREKELEKQREQLEKATSEKQSRTTSPEFLVKLKDCEVLEGNDTSFEIVVSGDPEPVVEWFLDEKLISNDKRHMLKDHGAVHSLTITDIQLDDEGIYECVAKNSAGKTTCDCELLVND